MKLKPNTVYSFNYFSGEAEFIIKIRTDSLGELTDDRWQGDWYTHEELVECAAAHVGMQIEHIIESVTDGVEPVECCECEATL